MKGIVYRDACAGETNGAWGSRVLIGGLYCADG